MKRLLPMWAVLGFIALLVSVVAFSPSQTTSATLTVTEGHVTVWRVSDTPLIRQPTELKAVAGETIVVQAADTIQLDATASATLWLTDGSTVEMSPGTMIEMTELVDSEDSFRARFTLLAGKTVNRVVRLMGAKDAYEIRTPSSVATVQGTVFTVEVVSATSSYIAVEEGVVVVSMEGQTVSLQVGEEVIATLGQPLVVNPQGERPPAVPPTSPTLGSPIPSTTTAVSPTATPSATSSRPARSTSAMPSPSATPVGLPALPTVSSGAPPVTSPVPRATLPVLPTVAPPLPTAPPSTNLPPTSSPPTAAPPPALPPTALPPTALPPTALPPTALPSPTPAPGPEMVTICHIPPGQPENAQTIQVPADEVQAHLDHGDYLGPCR
jgi:hypothetical protein